MLVCMYAHVCACTRTQCVCVRTHVSEGVHTYVCMYLYLCLVFCFKVDNRCCVFLFISIILVLRVYNMRVSNSSMVYKNVYFWLL